MELLAFLLNVLVGIQSVTGGWANWSRARRRWTLLVLFPVIPLAGLLILT